MRRRLFATFASLLLIRGIALAGGPLTVTGPAALQPGQPLSGRQALQFTTPLTPAR
jgi:hypothetical protein